MQTEKKKNKFWDDLPLYLFIGVLVIGFLALVVYLIFSTITN